MLAVTLATALWGAALPAWPVWLALNVAFFNAVVARRRAAAIASVIIHWPARHRPAGYLAAPVLHRSTRICPRGRRPAGPADRTMDGMAIIEICGLPKRFGAVAAISHLSFDVERGSVTGFLGPNGAGKPVTELRHSLAQIPDFAPARDHTRPHWRPQPPNPWRERAVDTVITERRVLAIQRTGAGARLIKIGRAHV